LLIILGFLNQGYSLYLGCLPLSFEGEGETPVVRLLNNTLFGKEKLQTTQKLGKGAKS